MIDLKDLRTDPDRYKRGAREKAIDVNIDELLRLDERYRRLLADVEGRRAEQKKLSKEIGPQIGKLRKQLKDAGTAQTDALEADIRLLEERPLKFKAEIQAYEHEIAKILPQRDELLLQVPQPPDLDVPKGDGPQDNVELRQWAPDGFDPAKSFIENRGFAPRTHVELVDSLGLADFERAVKIAGARHYMLTGAGMRLHQAILRFALDTIVEDCGFTPISVPVIVREECMVGTGFFPSGRDQAYLVEETSRGAGCDLYLTGTGEVSLMGMHQDEILDAADLPLKYATVSTCFRREAGAAGKDTAGLYRIHQFDKVEQVVIGPADKGLSRQLHEQMIGFSEGILQRLGLAYRLLQCCTADLGAKNADMIDIECWMPGRGETGSDGHPTGDWGETHSASRLYEYQCRRLNMRYRDESGNTVFCHSLNNTVIASPRILVPVLEMHQNEDGSVTVPEPLRAYMGGMERICSR